MALALVVFAYGFWFCKLFQTPEYLEVRHWSKEPGDPEQPPGTRLSLGTAQPGMVWLQSSKLDYSTDLRFFMYVCNICIFIYIYVLCVYV